MTIISNCTASIIKDAALALKEGHLVAFPTETVYGLGADATNEKAVARIYEVKGRPTDHPLIVHISSMELMDKWASEIPDYAIKLARAFWPGPMTLVLKRTELAKDFITGGQDTVAIRVPSHTLANQLLKEFESLGGYGVAAPSANRFGKVSPTTAKAVEDGIGTNLAVFDKILEGGNSIVGIESTIINCCGVTPIVSRPGSVTESEVKLLIQHEDYDLFPQDKKIRVPGSLKSHYKPETTVILSSNPEKGDGFIAFKSTPTPDGVIRLASPKNISEYARDLYEALRMADYLKLKRVCLVKAPNIGIGIAINDRLVKMVL
jgi:L-threonylcarbamoyladenylate synthase